jgi:hypothetical protein
MSADGVNTTTAPSRARVVLTDQALVAVTLARRHAGSGRATVAHLVVGLASEPEGAAARLLRPHDAAAARLADRLGSAPPRLPSVEVALGWAAGAVRGRPLWTTDLLAAALEVGAADLADLLAACSLELADLPEASPDGLTPHALLDRAGALAETHGYDPADATFTPPAARSVARARALGGGAVALVVALAAEHAVAPDAVPLDPDELAVRLRATRRPDVLWLPAPDERDRGLDAVVDAACRIRAAGRRVTPLDLLRAALLAGGRRPAALLAPARSEPAG